MEDLRTRLQLINDRLKAAAPAAFFILGILVDIITTDRIDSPLVIAMQAVYLAVAGVLLLLEAQGYRKWPLQRKFLLHFLFGSLLSLYSIFYFKSASLINSFYFLLLLVFLLVANESERFQRLGLPLRFALYSLCLTTYFVYLYPILFGYVGKAPFSSAILSTVAVYAVIYFVLRRKQAFRVLLIRVLSPLSGILGLFVLLYYTQAIPPVPISIQHLGIYHDVKKADGKYVVQYTRPWWKFWQSGDQTFLARPGDRLFCFTRIFAPRKFQDRVRVKWSRINARGNWEVWDDIPIRIVGGREEGFRGYVNKSKFQAGDWRVQILTLDGREIGRLSFDVIDDDSTDQREYREEVH